MDTGHTFVMDIMITHPMYHEQITRTEPLAAAKAGEKTKIERYTKSYDIAEADVIPLVFESSGGYVPKTMQFFRYLAKTLAQDDDDLAGEIIRHIRDRIAVALHIGQGNLISTYNRVNGALGGTHKKSRCRPDSWFHRHVLDRQQPRRQRI